MDAGGAVGTAAIQLARGLDADVDAVRREVVARLGPSPVQYVQADVCRRELLVEIEALGLRDL